jgi:hypothetical protein
MMLDTQSCLQTMEAALIRAFSDLAVGPSNFESEFLMSLLFQGGKTMSPKSKCDDNFGSGYPQTPYISHIAHVMINCHRTGELNLPVAIDIYGVNDLSKISNEAATSLLLIVERILNEICTQLRDLSKPRCKVTQFVDFIMEPFKLLTSEKGILCVFMTLCLNHLCVSSNGIFTSPPRHI